VTVPPPGAQPDLLFRRMCSVFGIEPQWAMNVSDRGNPSMGIAETAVVRQLNRRLHKDQLSPAQHARLVKDLLVHNTLAHRRNMTLATLPPGLYPWAEQVTEGWVEWIVGSGVDVVGDVSELRPLSPPDDQEWADPDRPSRKDMLNATLDGLAVMTQEAARRLDPQQQLSGKVSKAMKSIRGQ
jgi:hypothetical protein